MIICHNFILKSPVYKSDPRASSNSVSKIFIGCEGKAGKVDANNRNLGPTFTAPQKSWTFTLELQQNVDHGIN